MNKNKVKVEKNISIIKFLTPVKRPKFGSSNDFIKRKIAENSTKNNDIHENTEKEVSEITHNTTKSKCCQSTETELKRAKILLKKTSEIILEKEIKIKQLQNKLGEEYQRQ